MGQTWLSEQEVSQLMAELEGEWPGKDYDLLHHNCCHFSSELCRRLGVGPVPQWVTNLAGAGADLEHSLVTAATTARSTAMSAAIIAAAKAGEIDEEYKIRGTVTAGTQDLLAQVGHVAEQAGRMDEEYQIRQTASAGAQDLFAKVGTVTSNVVEQASPHASMVMEEAGKATQKTVELAQDAVSGVLPLAQDAVSGAQDAVSGVLPLCGEILETGRQALGASASDEYQFSDIPRGLVQRFSAWSPDWSGGAEDPLL